MTPVSDAQGPAKAGADALILLDTNICIHIINAKPPAVLQRFRDYRMGEIGLCSVVAAELACGVAKSGSTRNREALDLFLGRSLVLRRSAR